MTATETTTNRTESRTFQFGTAGRLPSVLCIFVLLIGVLAPGGCRDSAVEEPAASNEPNVPAAPANEPNKALPSPGQSDTSTPEFGQEISLFDGKTLGQWKVTDFGGQGDVYVKDGAIYMEMGSDLTGITWAGPVIRTNYEITLDAKRVSGSDFFCGLTFPVGDNPCSLILGGWGGQVCGLSNIDYYDAANNETTRMAAFKENQWYHVRLRVTPKRISAWLDDDEEPLVDIEITGRKIDIRSEVDLSQPLGIATWQTAGAVRNIRVKRIAE